jgi:hypothetical protein
MRGSSSFSAKDIEELKSNPPLTTPVAPATTTSTTASPFEAKAAPVSTTGTQTSEDLFGPPKTTAQEVLRKENIGSAKDILKQTTFLKSEDILKSQNITSAQDILEQERLIQKGRKFAEDQKLKQMQDEALFNKQEAEYIKNLDPNKINSSYEPIYNTKFGELNFKDAKFDSFSHAGWQTMGQVQLGKEMYFFLPEEYIYKGIKYSSGHTGVNIAFLNDKHWDTFLEKSQYIDLADTSINKSSLFPHYSQEDSSRGFLFKQTDLQTVLPADTFRSFTVGSDAWGGEILGLSSYKGQLVYAQANVGKSHTSYLDANGMRRRHWTEQKKGILSGVPIIGQPLTNLATEIAKGFAQIPFGAEIAFFASGGNKYLYASLKALEVAGKGGKLEDRFKAGAIAFATASTPMTKITGNVADFFVAEGIITNAAVAKFAAGSIVGAAFQGTLAAAQGQDVGAAMKTGAISGGVGATATEITTNIFGGTGGATVGAERVAKIAKSVNMTPAQFSNIFAGSLSSGAIASAVQDKDFFDAFKESLIARGVSTSASNAIALSLKTDTKMSAENIKIIEKNTRNIIEAMARSAVRGEDYETALKRVTFMSAKGGAELGGSILGKTIGELTSGTKKT